MRNKLEIEYNGEQIEVTYYISKPRHATHFDEGESGSPEIESIKDCEGLEIMDEYTQLELEEINEKILKYEYE